MSTISLHSFHQIKLLKLLLIFGMIIVALGSCKEVEKIEEDLDIYSVEELALTIENNLNTYRSDSINNKFSPVLFSWRFGSDFKQNYSAAERQGLYSAFNTLYKQSIDTYAEGMELLDLQIVLFDIHKKDNVYRLNYYVTDANEDVINYIIFYVDKDRDDEFKVVNFYNINSGFTYSDNVAEYLDGGIFGTDRAAIREISRAANKRDVALYHSSGQNYEKAYELMKEIDYKYLNSSGFASYKMIFASHISDSLYMEELKWMRAISINEASKKYYDCILLGLNSEENLVTACVKDFEMFLKEN